MDQKTILSALDLEPVESEITDVFVPESGENEELIQNDFDYARENLYSVIDQGNKAFENMIDVARASEHPRAYEVVSTLMNTLVNANKELLDLSKKKKELALKTTEESSPQTINNNLVLTTMDLQKALKGMINVPD